MRYLALLALVFCLGSPSAALAFEPESPDAAFLDTAPPLEVARDPDVLAALAVDAPRTIVTGYVVIRGMLIPLTALPPADPWPDMLVEVNGRVADQDAAFASTRRPTMSKPDKKPPEAALGTSPSAAPAGDKPAETEPAPPAAEQPTEAPGPEVQDLIGHTEVATPERARGGPKGVARLETDEAEEGHVYLEPGGRVHVHRPDGSVSTIS